MGTSERGMRNGDLKVRTKLFALSVISLVEALPRSRSSDVIAKQMLRSGTSVGANYRAACRARSQAEFIAKLGIVEEEADETLYWLELLLDSKTAKPEQVEALNREANELVAIFTAASITAKTKYKTTNQQSEVKNQKSKN